MTGMTRFSLDPAPFYTSFPLPCTFKKESGFRLGTGSLTGSPLLRGKKNVLCWGVLYSEAPLSEVPLSEVPLSEVRLYTGK